MRDERSTITSLPPSPEDERRGRMIQYLVMMGIRVACILMLPFLRGWWLVLPVIGAVFLPYFAVVTANVVRRSRTGTVMRPGGLRRLGETDETGAPGDDDGRMR